MVLCSSPSFWNLAPASNQDTADALIADDAVSPANNSSPRKRSPARKTARKTSKRATGRRKAA
jgi:hypothetical protein